MYALIGAPADHDRGAVQLSSPNANYIILKITKIEG